MAETTRKPSKRTKSRWLYPRTTRLGGLTMNLVKWLKMDLQENMLNWKHGNNEVRLTA